MLGIGHPFQLGNLSNNLEKNKKGVKALFCLRILFNQMQMITIVRFLLFMFLFFAKIYVSHSQNTLLGLNPILREQNDIEVENCFNLLEKYFANRGTIKRYNYWNPMDFKKMNSPDRYMHDFCNSEYYEDQSYYKPTILYLNKEHDNSYKVVISFSRCFLSEFSSVAAIIVANIIQVNGELRITNSLFQNLKMNHWKQVKQAEITIHHAPEIVFESNQAKKLEEFSIKMSKVFMIQKPLHFTYVACTSFEEVQNIRGIKFDLTAESGGNAQTDLENSIIYVANGRFDYFHEVVHIYYYQNYKKTKCYNEFWNEGLATYWGGSMDQTFAKLLDQIKIAPEFKNYDFGDLESLGPITSLPNVNISYTIGGLLCSRIFNKLGQVNGLKQILLINNIDETYKVIENVLGIRRDRINQYLRDEINKS